MKSSSPFSTPTIMESSLPVKMCFLRKYFVAIFGEFFLTSVISSGIMFTPSSRFYIAENEWIMYLLCFTYFVSYMSLIYFAKLPVIYRALFTHVIIQACAFGTFVTYHDLMYLYKAILISTFSVFGILLFTMQAQWNFSVWIVIFISLPCIYYSTAVLTAMFGATTEENGLTLLITVLILFYQTCVISLIIKSLSPGDYLYALINAHTIPINVIAFSTYMFKPTL